MYFLSESKELSMKKVAPLHYNVIFKKAFSVPEIFTAFVHDFLNIDLDIKTVEKDKVYDPPIGRIATKFDLYAEDHRVVVDVQHVRFPDHYYRFLHYHCAALLEQLVNSKDYCPGLKVYTLVILTSGDRHKKDIAITDFDPIDLEGNPLGEIGHKIIYICPKYLNNGKIGDRPHLIFFIQQKNYSFGSKKLLANNALKRNVVCSLLFFLLFFQPRIETNQKYFASG